MKILVIDEEFPWPLNNGKRTRSYSLIRALAAQNEVTWLAYGEDGSDAARALEDIGIRCHSVPAPDRSQQGLRFYWRLFANLFSPLPYIVTSHVTARFERRLRELIDEGDFDLLLCEWSPYAIFLRDLEGIRSVVVAHNIESYIWARYEENETNPFRRWYIRIQKEKVERFERECFRWAEGATAVSEAEAREIEEYGAGYPVETVENGVDVDFFRPTPEASPEPHRMIFSGAMDWRPNQDAVEYMVEDILPAVREQLPDAEFRVVGRRPPDSITQLDALEGVSITGTVDDVRPYMAESAVCVVPLRIGGGSRLKILAAMAMGKPVISTSIGAEGLQVTHDRDIILADGPEEIARTLVECLRDPDRMRKIADAGRALVEDHYRWESLGAKLHAYLTRVVDDR